MERKLLQIAFALTGLVLVGFGLAGVFFGANFMDLAGNAAGLIYRSPIPDIERHGEQISLITFILVLGGVPRLMAVIGHGVPAIGILIGPAGELIFAPLSWLWQRHVASAAQRGALI